MIAPVAATDDHSVLLVHASCSHKRSKSVTDTLSTGVLLVAVEVHCQVTSISIQV